MKPCPRLTDQQAEELSRFIRGKDNEIKEIQRAQSILLLNQGVDLLVITRATSYHRRQIFESRAKYLVKGLKGIATRRKGKPKELLTRKQLAEIVKIVKKKDSPAKFGYESKYWTTGMLADFIQKYYKVRYKSKTSYYVIFKRVKFTYHKPGRVWEKQDPEKVKKWKERNEPKLKAVWGNPKVVILCEDEMKLSSQTTFQKIWLPAGEYPKVEVASKKESKSIYGFLNLKTGKQHAFVASWQNMYITKKMLVAIRRLYTTEKILLFWDGPGSHRGKEVSDFIEKDGTIEVIFFPPYTPELNPQEHVWNKGREIVTHNQFIPDVDKVANDFVNYLNQTRFPYSLLGFSAKS